MFQKKKQSLPSVLHSEKKANTSQLKFDLNSPIDKFDHSSKFLLETLSEINQKPLQPLIKNKNTKYSESDFTNAIDKSMKTERNKIDQENLCKLDEQTNSSQYISIIQNAQKDKKSIVDKLLQKTIPLSNHNPHKKQSSMNIPPSYYLQQSNIFQNKNNLKKNKFSFSGTEDFFQKHKTLLDTADQNFISKDFVFQDTQSFDNLFNDQSINQNSINQLQFNRITKENSKEDQKYSNSYTQQYHQQMNGSISTSRIHKLNKQQASIDKLLKSPLTIQDNLELKSILPKGKHSNPIHLTMKSFYSNKGKNLYQLETEVSKIKENLFKNQYFSIPTKETKKRQSINNESLLTPQNEPSNHMEEEKTTLYSAINSPRAAFTMTGNSFKQSLLKGFQINKEPKMNNSIIKCLQDKTILQEDFIKQVLYHENKDDEKNCFANYLKKKQMHFTQNAEIIDLLEQIDIHYKAFNNADSLTQKIHKNFFKVASMDTIKKDLQAYQKYEQIKFDYQISQEREECRSLQNWLSQMVEKVLSKSNYTFQQTFSELELVYHGCFQELIRQIANNCQERGDILVQIWNQYNYLISKLFSMHRCIIDQQSQEDLQRVNYLSELIEVKCGEFSSTIKELSSKLEKEEETNKKQNDSNIYLLKKINKIQKEKLEIQSDLANMEQNLDELKIQHKHLLNQFNDLEGALKSQPSLNMENILIDQQKQQNMIENKQQQQNIKQYTINLTQNILPTQLLCTQQLILQQPQLNLEQEINKYNLSICQIQEESQLNQSIRNKQTSFQSIRSLDIEMQNLQNQTKLQFDGIQNKSMNTSFHYFTDRVDMCVNTDNTYENLIQFNQQIQCDLYVDRFGNTRSRVLDNELQELEDMEEQDYQDLVTQLNNHLLNLGNTRKQQEELKNPEFYFKKLKTMKNELAQLFERKKVTVPEVKTKVISIQDQQGQILKDLLQELIDSNSQVLDYKLIIADKDLKIKELEDALAQNQLKIDFIKQNYIQNHLSDQKNDFHEIQIDSPLLQPDSSSLINLNPITLQSKFTEESSASSTTIQDKIILNEVEQNKHTQNQHLQIQHKQQIQTPTDNIQQKVDLEEQKYNQISKEKNDNKQFNNNDIKQIQQPQEVTQAKGNTDVTITSVQIKKQAGGGFKSQQNKKNKRISIAQNAVSISKDIVKETIQGINEVNETPKNRNSQQMNFLSEETQQNSPKHSINRKSIVQQRQSFKFKKPSVQLPTQFVVKLRKDSEVQQQLLYQSPLKKKKQIKPYQFFNKASNMTEKAKNEQMSNKEAAKLILETAQVAIIQEQDFKQINQILKIIQSVYNENFKQYKKGDTDGSQSMIYILYDQFLHRFGVRKIAEQKLLQVLVQIKKSDSNPKIKTFARLIGLYKEQTLQPFDLQFFTKAMALLEEYSNQGKNHQTQLEKIKITKEKIHDAVRLFFGRIISMEVDEITTDLENYKTISQNTQQNIVIEQINPNEFDIDIISEKLLSLNLQVQDIAIKRFKRIYETVQSEDSIDQEEFLILTRWINGKEIYLAGLFNQKADKYQEKLRMSLQRFCILCLENNLLSEKDQLDYLKNYQQNNNCALIENKINSLKEMSTNWELIVTIIKTRLIYSNQYKKVYQFMINKIEVFLKQTFKANEINFEEQYIKNDLIMLMYRILCDESRKILLEYETNQILGEQLTEISSNIKQQLYKIM